jgi:hypothetical protein
MSLNKKDIKLHTKQERHKVTNKKKKDIKLHTKQERKKVIYKTRKT